MSAIQRRRFLAGLGQGGVLVAARSVLDAIGQAQIPRGPARAFIQQSHGRADLDRPILGSFLEDPLLVGGFVNRCCEMRTASALAASRNWSTSSRRW